MPSKSAKQARFMEAVVHGMKPKKKGPSVAVAKEFVAADKATGKFARHAKLKALLKKKS